MAGVSALLVLMSAREPSVFLISQPQPEPKVVTEVAVKRSLNVAKEPKVWWMAFASSPVGSPPPWGERQFQ